MIGKEIGASSRRMTLLNQMMTVEQDRLALAYRKSNDQSLIPARHTLLMDWVQAYLRELRRRK